MLEGIRVLDLSRILPGPYATQLLADAGAEVIKVEMPPEGDYLRTAPPLMDLEDKAGCHRVGAVFAQVNRGKKSLALNFTSPMGRDILLQLARTADVLVESFQPGALARRGLDFESLRPTNPRLIYCSLSGYGQDGPYRRRVGHDLNFLAMAGILGLNARSNGLPVLPPVQIADLSGGMLAAVRILAALVERARTGEGRFLDIALLDAATDWMQTIIGALYDANGSNPGPGQLPLTGAYPCYNIYETADGAFMSLAALESGFWKSFCTAIGREDLVDQQLEESAIETLRSIFRTRTRSEWTELATQWNVCLEPVLSVREALDHPQLRLRAATFGTPTMIRSNLGVPRLGQDTNSLLKQQGITELEIARLEAAGVVCINEQG